MKTQNKGCCAILHREHCPVIPCYNYDNSEPADSKKVKPKGLVSSIWGKLKMSGDPPGQNAFEKVIFALFGVIDKPVTYFRGKISKICILVKSSQHPLRWSVQELLTIDNNLRILIILPSALTR